MNSRPIKLPRRLTWGRLRRLSDCSPRTHASSTRQRVVVFTGTPHHTLIQDAAASHTLLQYTTFYYRPIECCISPL
ncbi:hypothetical protein E2C01_036098 [Portunus trituberculatus]|uniref:Uncharacterized protein n=1 Tax=Portunus trituberculatus TaxID=210409 RepID=A0A5B7FAY6_PORTR|nr:hypothetical protein [Portunus trituberculatus]